MSKKKDEKEVAKDLLKQMLYDYGNEGVLKLLILSLFDFADDKSDDHFKDQANEASELAYTLINVRSKLKVGRHKMAIE